MEDETIQAIDRFFDRIDKGVEVADRVLNRGQQAADRSKQVVDEHKVRRVKREVIDTAATPKKEPVKTTAVVRKPHFYIVEATDKSGSTIFVVTDGGKARTECGTREFAHRILCALEKAS